MAREYQLDTDAAKEANSGGKRITESGPYTGKLRAAFYEQNEKGTESVNFVFEANTGQEVGPLALYTHNGDGKELPGYNVFNALLTCMRVKQVKAVRGKVELYDFDSQSVVSKDKEIYPDLTGKAVGLVLRREEYVNRNGETKERMTLFAPFESATNLMADEILGRQTESKSLPRIVEWLAREPVKHVKGARASTPNHGSASVPEDDEIPF